MVNLYRSVSRSDSMIMRKATWGSDRSGLPCYARGAIRGQPSSKLGNLIASALRQGVGDDADPAREQNAQQGAAGGQPPYGTEVEQRAVRTAADDQPGAKRSQRRADHLHRGIEAHEAAPQAGLGAARNDRHRRPEATGHEYEEQHRP